MPFGLPLACPFPLVVETFLFFKLVSVAVAVVVAVLLLEEASIVLVVVDVPDKRSVAKVPFLLRDLDPVAELGIACWF